MPLSVIGAGFGRTGTMSSKLALEKLGLGKCYHMLEVRENPDHAAVWSSAVDGGQVEWDSLFAGFGAAVDWPACHFWRELAAHYPDAKVMLTVRDPERWYQSVRNTIYRAMTGPIADDDTNRRERMGMANKIILEQTFDGRFEDRAHAIDVYQRHNEAVRRDVPAERLLVHEVAQGWDPLCRFLGLPVPDEPFPQLNTTAEFRARFNESQDSGLPAAQGQRAAGQAP